MSGHNTSIAKSRLGCRLPYESPDVGDGYAAPGPVIEYRLSPEEIAAQYGAPREIKERALTRKAINYAMEHTSSLFEAAKFLKVNKRHVVAELARYGLAIPELWKEDKAVEIVENGEVMQQDAKAAPELAPTPLEALEQGVPLEQARRMRPEDLTKEAAEKLLAAGVTRRLLVELYGFASCGSLYPRLEKFGLHERKARNKKTKAESRPRQEQQQNGKVISVAKALEEQALARENARCLKEIINIVTKKYDISLTENVMADLSALQRAYEDRAAKISLALDKVTVEVML